MNFLRLLFVAVLLTVSASKLSHAQIIFNADFTGVADGTVVDATVTVTGPGGAVATFGGNGNVNFSSEQILLTSDGGRDSLEIDVDTAVAAGVLSFDMQRTAQPSGTDNFSVQLTEGGRGTTTAPVPGFAHFAEATPFDAPATERASYIFNTTGAAVDYTAPDGSTQSVGAGTFDFFIGNNQLEDDNDGILGVTTAASAGLTTFVVQTFNGANGSVLAFDNITLESFSTGVLLGDVDLSGAVTFLDISPFIGVLSSNGFQAEADIDGNGTVNFLDIAPFIAILANP